MAGIGKGAAHRHVIMQCILVRDRGFSAPKNVPAARGKHQVGVLDRLFQERGKGEIIVEFDTETRTSFWGRAAIDNQRRTDAYRYKTAATASLAKSINPWGNMPSRIMITMKKIPRTDVETRRFSGESCSSTLV